MSSSTGPSSNSVAAASGSSNSSSSRRNYDPAIIIKAADDKLSSNDVAGGQTLYQSALLNWVDDARENVFGQDPEQMREAIATLWIAYAHFLRKAKQFKSATEAYEQAVECPVSGAVGRVWIDYGRFLDERDKQRTAQQVYLRALHDNQGGVVRDEQDRNLLWNEFLEMMRKRNPNLTLVQLQQAIEDETKTAVDSSSSSYTPTTTTTTKLEAAAEDDNAFYDDLQQPPETVSSSYSNVNNKRSRSNSTDPVVKMENNDTLNDIEGIQSSSSTNQTVQRSHVVTAADIDLEKNMLQELAENAQNDPGFMATWMARDGNASPQPPTPLFGCSPPKLSDPTGKDFLGEELALQLIQTLLRPSGPIILQVCRGLWMLNGLKEHQAQKALAQLDGTIKKEITTLQARLDERLSVAGAAESAVRQMNESERQSFQANCNQQRQSLLNSIAWEQRQLLWCQQQLLTKLKIPGFHGTTVDESELEFQTRICSYLHSAFFLLERIGPDSYSNMLKSQEERLKQLILKSKDTNSNSNTTQPKKKKSRFSPPNTTASAAAAAARLTPPPPSTMAQLPPPPPPMQVYQQHAPHLIYGQQQQQQQQQQQMMMMMQPPLNMSGVYPPLQNQPPQSNYYPPPPPPNL